ncbi:transglycosylase domain-containing protein [Chamaesiphon sp. VAR_48_metabat_135_sub]|uniref:transglycosylase domain-containing protein n=1 Tax=Chamaesiphon sp. VAR_48_metabat_135_sub TaxID=2964699 RepID=UPI0037C120CF
MSSRALKKNKPQPMGRKPENGSFFGGIGQIAGGTILGVTMLASSIVAGGLVGLAISFRNLPDVRVLRSYAPTETTYIYDVKGVQLASLHDEANREVVPLNRISPNLKRSLLAIEDSHFYYHQGVNLTGVGRAITANFKKGGVSEGGSTITMQLIKNLFLSQKRQFSRKLAEAVLSIRLEQIFRKDEILEMYLNQVYWGHNNYGVETAAQSYFNKHASDLNLAEGAMMAGAIAAPEKYSPFTNFKSAKKRQEQVLNRMVELNWITAADAKKAKDYKIKLGKIKTWQSSRLPYVTDTAIEELNQRFGRETVRKGGMRIQTTIDYNFQMAAQKVVANAYDRLGRNKYQISLVAIDPRTHFVKAMVGGVDYKKSNFNRAMYANRQPGSSFKPFVYYTAFATGKFTPDSTVYDTPVRYRDGSGYYAPRNYGGGYSGPMSIRSAIMTSANVPAVKMGKEVGLDKVIQTCRTLGIKSPIEPVVSLPLGAIGVTPVEMAGAFATFASNGWQSETTTILRVTDSDGNVLLDNTPQPQQVLNPWATAQINSALQSVVSGGTGKQAYLGRPAAGKTGTTSSERDVWFVGYVPQLAASVWIGKDDYTPLGKGVTGGTYAAPIWRSFMQEALQNEPVESFQSPAKFKRPGS